MRNPTDERILRDVMIRELETIQEYDRMIDQAENADVRRFLAHAVYEEKEHVAEAMQLLGQLDPMQREAIEEDHSAHFRAGGPGDDALRRITGEFAEDAASSPSPASPSAAPEAANGDVVSGHTPASHTAASHTAAGHTAAGHTAAGDAAAAGGASIESRGGAAAEVHEAPARVTVGNPRSVQPAVTATDSTRNGDSTKNGTPTMNGSATASDAAAPTDADANPFPWTMAPNARLSEATVGAIRGSDR